MQNLYAFSATSSGNWRVVDMKPVAGAPLPSASALSIARVDSLIPSTDQAWTLHGLMSNLRYAKRDELTSLRSKQEGLGRPSARRAALIPIKKSAAWWDLAQDERRAIFEEQSRHTAIGLDYLPAIARQLYHSRDLSEPFDFLTWFEYAPEHAQAFEDLVGKLRETSEWRYIEREIDIRLERAV